MSDFRPNGEPVESIARARTLAEAANLFALTLVEPLIPLPRRMVAEDDFATACRQKPEWAAVVFGGVVSNLVQTLPPGDPWRRLSGRIANLTCGEIPPATDGAVTPSGEPFGSFRDARDMAELVFDDPHHDVALVALADPLSPQAAGLLAFGGWGWQAAVRACRALHERAVPDEEDTPTGVVYPERWRESIGARSLFDSGTAAVRWSLHRRASYGITGDFWPLQSFAQWAKRADMQIDGVDWPADEVDEAIAAETIDQAPEDF